MKKTILNLILILSIFCGLVSCSGCDKFSADDCDLISWEGGLPIAIDAKNDNEVEAIDAWNSALGKEVFFVDSSGIKILNLKSDNFISKSPDAHALGLTVSNQTNECLSTSATIYLNSLHQTSDDGRYGTRYPYVVAHELGHVLGLSHIEDDFKNIMFPSSPNVSVPMVELIDRPSIIEALSQRYPELFNKK